MKKIIEFISNGLKQYGKSMDRYGTAIITVKTRS
jgi:hypothetical protein